MTDTDVNVETLAQAIASRGRDALVERLRVAYSDAAAVHADIVALDDERIEALVQSAANRADGLQWRRALAGVAAEELDLTIPEALSHPAVVRAQTLVGAPSYEQSLAELIARPVPPTSTNGGEPTGAPAGAPTSAVAAPFDGQLELEAEPVPEADEPEPALQSDEPEPVPEADEPEPALQSDEPEPVSEAVEPQAERLEAVEADDEVFDLLPEPDPVELDTALYQTQPEYTERDNPSTPEPEPVAEQTDGAEEASPEDSATTEEPSSEPEASLSEPEAPLSEPEAPLSEPEASLSEPEAPLSEPEAPLSEPEAPPVAKEPTSGEDLRVTAVHIGGVANLPTHQDGLSLCLSEDGLDILESSGRIIGRLVWEEIDALDVPHMRSRRRRQQAAHARLVVRTAHGDASFEIPEVASDELRDRIEPLVSRYGRH